MDFTLAPIEQFAFARRADLGLGPNQLYGVGVSSAFQYAMFLSGSAAGFVQVAYLAGDGIAAAAAKIRPGPGPVTSTNTDAAVLTKDAATGQLAVKLFRVDQALSTLAQIAVPAPATHIAAGKFRSNDPEAIGQLFIFATNPLSETCLEYGTIVLHTCN